MRTVIQLLCFILISNKSVCIAKEFDVEIGIRDEIGGGSLSIDTLTKRTDKGTIKLESDGKTRVIYSTEIKIIDEKGVQYLILDIVDNNSEFKKFYNVIFIKGEEELHFDLFGDSKIFVSIRSKK